MSFFAGVSEAQVPETCETIREREISEASVLYYTRRTDINDWLDRRKSTLWDEIDTLDNEIEALNDEITTKQRKLALYDEQLAALEAELAEWWNNVWFIPTEEQLAVPNGIVDQIKHTGSNRKDTQAEIDALKDRIAEKRNQIDLNYTRIKVSESRATTLHQNNRNRLTHAVSRAWVRFAVCEK